MLVVLGSGEGCGDTWHVPWVLRSAAGSGEGSHGSGVEKELESPSPCHQHRLTPEHEGARQGEREGTGFRPSTTQRVPEGGSTTEGGGGKECLHFEASLGLRGRAAERPPRCPCSVPVRSSCGVQEPGPSGWGPVRDLLGIYLQGGGGGSTWGGAGAAGELLRPLADVGLQQEHRGHDSGDMIDSFNLSCLKVSNRQRRTQPGAWEQFLGQARRHVLVACS